MLILLCIFIGFSFTDKNFFFLKKALALFHLRSKWILQCRLEYRTRSEFEWEGSVLFFNGVLAAILSGFQKVWSLDHWKIKLWVTFIYLLTPKCMEFRWFGCSAFKYPMKSWQQFWNWFSKSPVFSNKLRFLFLFQSTNWGRERSWVCLLRNLRRTWRQRSLSIRKGSNPTLCVQSRSE